jgi:ATP-dependent DNA helicase RecG
LFTETLPDYLMQELQLIPKKQLYSTFIFQSAEALAKANSIKI